MDPDRARNLLASRFGGPARTGYQAVTLGQRKLIGTYDRARVRREPPAERAATAERVTIAAKTFQRPAVARRFVRSARATFDGRIVIADDSRRPMVHRDPRVQVLALPFNSGVSKGRNAALDAVGSEFVLVTDDDIVFTRASDVTAARHYLEDNPDVDIVGFTLVELPRWYVVGSGPDALFPGAEKPVRAFGELIGGLPVRYKIAQVYLARTASIRMVRWNEELRMVDHRDFFSRVSGTLVTVVDPGNFVYHARTPFDAEYTTFRDDTAADLAWLSRRWR